MAIPTPTLTPTPPPADGGTFASPDEIINKAWSTLPCGDSETETPTGAKAQMNCDDHNVIVRVYVDHRGVGEEVQTVGCAGGGWLLTGVNWTLNASKETLVAAQRKLGGNVIDAKCVRTADV